MSSPSVFDLPLSRSDVDRDAGAREDPDLIPRLLADEATRVLPMHRGRALLAAPADDPAVPRLALLAPSTVPEARLALYLGRTRSADGDLPAGTPVLAAVLDRTGAAALTDDESRWGDLRLLGAHLGARDAGLFTEALGLANWHHSHGFSPATGVPTIPARGGWVRHPDGETDEAGGRHVFPRTDPAIIVGVVDADDRLLLASNAAWPEDRFSVLAGFVEPGESFEAAVEREVAEEAGVIVGDVRYLGSQPWPFPASVMVGFLATVHPADPGEIRADGVEIREVRWFRRAELTAAIDAGLRLPGRTSIARAIIEHWFGGRLEGDW